MERPSRKRRAPHRGPKSLAIEPPILATDNSQIDPDLLDIDLPPQSPSQSPLQLPLNSPSKSSFLDPFESLDVDQNLPPNFDLDISAIDTQLPLRFTGWSVEMEALMYSTLCIQVGLGKRADNGFKKEAWQAVNKAILDAFRVVITTQQCKSKADSHKGLWREYNWLKDQSGFGINEYTGLIEAGEQAWADIIAVGCQVLKYKIHTNF